MSTPPKKPRFSRRHFELREVWWGLLDRFESSRRFRILTILTLTLVVAGGAGAIWGYPWWAQRNAVKMARAWLAAGNLKFAAEATQKALVASPESPDVWLLAAEIARRTGQSAMEVEYVHQAYTVSKGETSYGLLWASAALRTEDLKTARQALTQIPSAELEKSGFAQRLLGEIARRDKDFPKAIHHFTQSCNLEGATAVNQVPLGLCLAQSSTTDERTKGEAMLAQWITDEEWGAEALRLLLGRAVTNQIRSDMLRYASALIDHPSRTVGDMPNCLAVIAQTDSALFNSKLTKLQQDHLATVDSATQLISWLNQIGHAHEAVQWFSAFPQEHVKRPPLTAAVAESWRQTSKWSELLAHVEAAEWGEAAQFLQWAYGLCAAKALRQSDKESALWQTLLSYSQNHPKQGFFASSALYSWGLRSEAEALWWKCAEQNNNLSVEALGSLARHYQVSRDAAGLYRAFSKLYTLKPNDPDIANNFAFFAALTGNRTQYARQTAQEISNRFPQNTTYKATLSFALLRDGQPTESLELISPLAKEAQTDPAVAFAYGMALAGCSKVDDAKAVLLRIPPLSLTDQEVALVKKSLGLN